MSAEFTLGQRVSFTHELHRLTERNGYKAWRPHPNEEVSATPKEGVIVGKRRLTDGRRVWEPYDEGGGYEFIPKESFTGYLIAYSINRKPVYVRPEHITALGERPDYCPYDCDRCHDEDCPCDRMGCAGSETGPLH